MATTYDKHKQAQYGYKPVKCTDVELKFGVIVAESLIIMITETI